MRSILVVTMVFSLGVFAQTVPVESEVDLEKKEIAKIVELIKQEQKDLISKEKKEILSRNNSLPVNKIKKEKQDKVLLNSKKQMSYEEGLKLIKSYSEDTEIIEINFDL